MHKMHPINTRLKSSKGRTLVSCDDSMIRFIAKAKDGTVLIDVKILCEEFMDVFSYEVFTDRDSYVKYEYKRNTRVLY